MLVRWLLDVFMKSCRTIKVIFVCPYQFLKESSQYLKICQYLLSFVVVLLIRLILLVLLSLLLLLFVCVIVHATNCGAFIWLN